ncbi:cation channel sperm-associated auxiliary subunit delta isoform X2 [Peromyscus californicus insignis]|uniref:cation channel sperm-associated auxiliary subunit delta isoform X2 n=1 Tax=Peromyscus californicus insignis TaxID=564181 RepID=UPI0022A7B3E6|nr:cation channel sperm-associated auxiliary subunit delta isoform X2 [Peromyscus californicus insignis]
MLLLMLAAVATVVRAEPLCRPFNVRTGKVFGSKPLPEGDMLFYAFSSIHVLRDFCHSNVVLYLGKKIFISKDNFESSLPPLIIPKSMKVGAASVTSALFTSDSKLLFVVNKKVYMYNYLSNRWSRTLGISQPVSHVSGDKCCFKNEFCLELSNNVFAYLRGGPLPRTKIFFSDNGGFSFQYLASESLDRLKGTLGGIFHFYSLSQVGILEVKNKLGSFHYMEHPLNHSAGIPFKYSDSLDVIIKPGQRGFLVLWSQTSLLVSPNSGQIMETVQLWKGKTVVTPDISNIGINIHSLASNAYELALLTRENVVYYGNQGYLGTTLVQLPEQPVWSEEAGISFTDTGMLEVLTPVADPRFPAFDFQKCIVNVQYVLNNASLQIEPCNVEFLDSTMVEQMFTIDMNSKLELSALMIPRPGKIPIPLVMVSNPHSMGLEAQIHEFGNTFDGNYKYKLEIELKQQQHQNRADLNFTTSIKRNAISSITVDIADKTIACVDLKPLSTLISVGCDKTKKILVQNKISACSMGILNPVELQRNYTYTIEKEAYRPVNYDAQAQADLLVYYQYKELGCPRLVYYDKPWKPVVEMWKDGVLEEIMDAEYVITEVNGITTYSYSLTAATANCRSQPQNWSTFQSDLHFLYQGSLWNRENYVSCHEDNKDNPLLWPEVEYQILGGQTDNRVIFGQRNGIYTFILSVVDPYYSYCSLDTMFSVYVDGALPMAFFSPELSITVLVFTALLSVWLAYAIPKELSTERGQRLTNFCSWLFQGCLGLCRCSWLWDRPKLWLRSRRVGDQPERIRSTQTN